jgi:hypothetical protein
MALTPDILGSKYKIVPGATTVTFKIAGAGSGVSIDGARKRPLTTAERMLTGFREGATDCTWILAATVLGSTVPQPGDSITEADGTVWIIGRVESALAESDYKCYAVKGR